MSSDHRSPQSNADNQQRRTEAEYEAPLYLLHQQRDTEASHQSSQSGHDVEECHRAGRPQQSQRLQRDHGEKNRLRHAGDNEQTKEDHDRAARRGTGNGRR